MLVEHLDRVEARGLLRAHEAQRVLDRVNALARGRRPGREDARADEADRRVTEFLNPLLMRVFGILYRQGKFGKAPMSLMVPVDGGKGMALAMPVVAITSRISMALKALQNQAIVNTLSPGDKVLRCETGHFATLWRNMAVKHGLQPEFIASDWRSGADPKAIEARLAEAAQMPTAADTTMTAVLEKVRLHTAEVRALRSAIPTGRRGDVIATDVAGSEQRPIVVRVFGEIDVNVRSQGIRHRRVQLLPRARRRRRHRRTGTHMNKHVTTAKDTSMDVSDGAMHATSAILSVIAYSTTRDGHIKTTSSDRKCIGHRRSSGSHLNPIDVSSIRRLERVLQGQLHRMYHGHQEISKITVADSRIINV